MILSVIPNILANAARRAAVAGVVLDGLNCAEVDGALRLSAVFNRTLAPKLDGFVVPDGFAGWVVHRQAEYAAGRVLAGAVLTELCDQSNVPRGAKRNPVWPEGVSGAITHFDDQVAVLIRRGAWRIGIDITKEPSPSALKALRSETLSTQDRRVLQQAALGPAMADTLGFSAKETLFKALYPEVQAFFGFGAAAILDVTSTQLTLGLTGQGLTPDLPGGATFQLGWRGDDLQVETWMVDACD